MTTKPELNPFDLFLPDPAADYPLTTGELVILAERWWDFVVDTEHFWVLANSVGSSEMRDREYALDRLRLLVQALGADHIERLRTEALARWRGRYGDIFWDAVQAKRPLIQINAWIDDHVRLRSREGTPDTTPPGEDHGSKTEDGMDSAFLNAAPLRAERLGDVLRLYPDDEHANVIDLLADLLHWCGANGVDFEDTLRISRRHFESERDKE